MWVPRRMVGAQLEHGDALPEGGDGITTTDTEVLVHLAKGLTFG